MLFLLGQGEMRGSSGALDLGFQADPNDTVRACAIPLAYGTVLIGGDFTYVGPYSRSHIALLTTNGAINLGFPAATDGSVNAIAVQADGKILIGGSFTQVNGVTRNNMARLNSDGTLDTGYVNPLLNGVVRSIAIQADGKILAAGDFTQAFGQWRYYLGRFLTNGKLDTGFATNPNGPISSVTASGIGDLITIGGYFTTVASSTRNFIAMLNSDDTVFTQFNPQPGANNYVYAVAVRSWNEIYLAGVFTALNGGTRNRIARLDDYGVVYLMGSAGGANDQVKALVIDSAGLPVIGGAFTTVDGQSIQKVARYDPGSSYVDTSFNAGSFSPSYCTVEAICIQSDGKIIIGGTFTSIQGTNRNRIARLLP